MKEPNTTLAATGFNKRLMVFIGPFLVMAAAHATAQAQVFQQDFSSSPNVADYISATPNNGQFNAIGTSGAGTTVSINSGALQYVRSGANVGSFSRTTDFSPTPSKIAYKVDITVSGNIAAQTTAAVFQIGSGFGTANGAESNASTYARFGINLSATNGSFSIRDITNATSSAEFSGRQTITWILNNSGGGTNYLAPDGTAQGVADDKADLYVGTTLVLNDVTVETAAQVMTDLKFAFTAGSATIRLDNLLIGSLSPTAARLQSFKALSTPDASVLLEWQTGFEVDNLGYNIYREEGAKRARITPQMIAGSALLAGPGVSLMSGRSYSWTDALARGKQGVRYWLEEVDLSGASTWHGPITVKRARDGDWLPSRGRERAVPLGELGAESAQHNQTTPIARAAKPAAITEAGLAAQFDLAGRAALKLAVKREGWYRLGAQELIAAGLDPRTDPRVLQLFVDGQEQSFIVDGEEDGKLDPPDAVEFYGVGLDTAATDTRVYWLVAGSQPGRRIQQVKGGGSRSTSASFQYTVERKERTIYFSGLRNGDRENFFGAVIASNPVDQLVGVLHLDKASAGDATIEVAVQGVTELPHRISVQFNGTALGDVSFEGQVEGVVTFSLSQAGLKEGQNTIRLRALGAEGDVSLVDHIRITYPHTYVADNNALQFSLSSKQQVAIDGFTSAAVRVLDITDPNEIRRVSARVQQQGEGYSVTVSAPKPGKRTLWAFADDQVKPVAAITSNRPSHLRDGEQAADFVIVTHRDFLDSVKPLQSLRESQGLGVAVVEVEDIYDEFSYGEKSPQAVRDFLAFAKTNWRKPPRFALLVGDASLDPKNYLGRGDFDLVPTRLIDTASMETASDDWLADFDGDGLAEMALGRLPVRTAGEASRIIGKIVSYDNAARTQNILLVSDLNDGIDFQNERVQVRRMAPSSVNVEQIDRGELGATAAKSQLIESLNRGPWIIDYSGHGSADQWRGNLLTSAEAGALSNGESLPVFFAMTCLNGYFQDPALDSLAESLMKAERGGAVAVWASSGMCDAGAQQAMDQEMFRVLFQGGESLTLGEAALRAKASVKDSDVRLTYILFGDPTSRLK